MSSHLAPLNKAATQLLATYGVKAIWDVYLAAAATHGMGEPELAASLINLAEAAERQLMSELSPSARY